MEHTVYFADKSVTFTQRTSSDTCHTVVFSGGEEVSRTKIQKILETENSVVVTATDPDQAYEAFAAGFALVEAAGGIVVNDRGEWLMIRRNDRWDMPKGHVESGEACEVCAVREIAEETGVCDAKVVRHLCDTRHAYFMHGRWELKRTHWYELHASGCDELTPQAEEGIECVAWCSAAEVIENLRTTFPTIRRVAEAMIANPTNT